MSTPHRDSGGTSGLPAPDYFSLPLQRSDLTDVSGLLDLADTELALQLRAFLNEQPMIDTSSHFAANAIAIFQGSEGTYTTAPTDRENHDQNDVSRTVLNQGIPSGQTSPVRTMTFQEIAAPPVPHDAKPRMTLPATRTQRPLDVRLARNEPSHCGFVDDRVMIHQLIHAGIIPDPAPHYLWDEVDPLIAWYKEELISRLNVLLDGENRLRHRAKTLIRHMSTVRGEGRQHVYLVKWCRTGGARTYRRKINFYMYDDWIARLGRFDFEEDVQIIDLMDLISEVYHRLFVSWTAYPVPALRAPANTTSAVQSVPKPMNVQPATQTYTSRATQHLQPTQLAMSASTHNSFEVYRDQPWRDSTQWSGPSSPSELQDSKKMPISSQQVDHAYKTFRDEPRPTSSQEKHRTNLMALQGKTNLPPEEGEGPSVAVCHDGGSSVGSIVATILSTSKRKIEDIEESGHGTKLQRSHSPEPEHQIHMMTDDARAQLLPLSSSTTFFAASLQVEQALIAKLKQEIVPHTEELSEGDMYNAELSPHGHKVALNSWLDGALGTNITKPTLFRKLEYPAANDFSQLARCIRFARSLSEQTTNWRVHPVHIQEMYKLTNVYGIELLRARSAMTYPLECTSYSLE
jgi:hypothetical protein